MDYSEDAQKMISELEAKRGGHIEWKTVCLFYADSDKNLKESVFLYKIGDTFYFEDFEKDCTFLGFKINPPKDYKYEKFEGSFKAIDVAYMEKVLKSDVIAFCEGRSDKVKIAGNLTALFKQTVSRIELENKKIIYLEVMKNNEFVQLVDLEKNKYKWIQTREVK